MTTGQQTHDEQDEQASDDTGDEAPHREHLADVDDGCGCTEIWEHLSENRGEAADD